jgi:transglutaminase-like putative cysteine protease
MSAVAQLPPTGAPVRAAAAISLPPSAVRIATFAALAAFCLAHYGVLVEPAAENPLVGILFATAAGGAALRASARLPRLLGLLARIATLVAMAVVALALSGLAPRLLLPGQWDELANGVDRGFAGLDSFRFPYDDGDRWVRLTVVLAMPVLAVLAAALAFWPARPRIASGLRAAALAPLLIAYGTAVTNLDPGEWALRGAVLLLLIAAYLWLPRLHGRDALLASAAVAGCCLAALPLAAGLDARDPWIDYESWDWFAQGESGTRFGWDHVYGPITWSRTGTMLLQIDSNEPHYWKAETLDRFDGLRWMHSEADYRGGASAAADIPTFVPDKWDEELTVTVRRLNSSVVVGAGTTYRTNLDRTVSDEPDGTVRILGDPLQAGDSYTAWAYVPDPTAEQMRAAAPEFPERLSPYTAFDLPAPDATGLDAPDLSEAAREQGRTSRTIQPPLAGAPLAPTDVQRVLDSPYARTYRLARRLAAGQPTTYDVVKAVERHLQEDFRYDENPPVRRYPLPAFLFDDKAGYCQQFSGAMALLLRMNGIPARVATGFSPGARNPTTKEYEIRDFDAHSWVEVWFDDIGWVPFDPTPSASPAGSQSSADDSASAARGGSSDSVSADLGARQREGADLSGGGPSANEGTGPWPLVLGGGALVALLIAALWLAGILRARPHFAATTDGAVQELRAALARLGYSYPSRTTLAELERRLRVTKGEPAARYVSVLRALRYAPPGAAAPPGQRERRELRRALAAGGGPLARLRALIALPPHPRRRAF